MPSGVTGIPVSRACTGLRAECRAYARLEMRTCPDGLASGVPRRSPRGFSSRQRSKCASSPPSGGAHLDLLLQKEEYSNSDCAGSVRRSEPPNRPTPLAGSLAQRYRGVGSASVRLTRKRCLRDLPEGGSPPERGADAPPRLLLEEHTSTCSSRRRSTRTLTVPDPRAAPNHRIDQRL